MIEAKKILLITNIPNPYLKEIGISKLIMIETDIENETDYHRNTYEFANLFDLEVISVKGNMGIIERSYQQMKSELICMATLDDCGHSAENNMGSAVY